MSSSDRVRKQKSRLAQQDREARLIEGIACRLGAIAELIGEIQTRGTEKPTEESVRERIERYYHIYYGIKNVEREILKIKSSSVADFKNILEAGELISVAYGLSRAAEKRIMTVSMSSGSKDSTSAQRTEMIYIREEQLKFAALLLREPAVQFKAAHRILTDWSARKAKSDQAPATGV